jgi:hypothetical protein
VILSPRIGTDFTEGIDRLEHLAKDLVTTR